MAHKLNKKQLSTNSLSEFLKDSKIMSLSEFLKGSFSDMVYVRSHFRHRPIIK